MLTFRQLPPEEWPRIVEAGIEPFATYGLPDPTHWIFLVAEQDGGILGVSSLYETVHNDWFIAPAARRHPAIVQGLWNATRAALEEYGVQMIHATVSDAQVEVQAMVERLGYQKAQGQLYVLFVPNCVLNEESA